MEFISDRRCLELAIEAIDAGRISDAASLAYSASIGLSQQAMGGIGRCTTLSFPSTKLTLTPEPVPAKNPE